VAADALAGWHECVAGEGADRRRLRARRLRPADHLGIFLPSFLLVLIAALLLARYRLNPNVQGLVKGAYAAAIGTILGACILLGRIAIGDWLTALIAIMSLAVLFGWKVNNPLLIAATAVVGLIAYPPPQPDWVMVK
jgi:chromate transporter